MQSFLDRQSIIPVGISAASSSQIEQTARTSSAASRTLAAPEIHAQSDASGWSEIAPVSSPATKHDDASPDHEEVWLEMDMMLEIGNNSQPCDDSDRLITLDEMNEKGLNRWCWDMFLQAGRCSHCIQCVVYHLHESFYQSVVTVEAANSADGSFHSPAYSGYGGFAVKVEVHLNPGWEPRVVSFDHKLSLTVGGDSQYLPVHITRTPTVTADEKAERTECTICLSPVKDVTSMLGYCSHVFHDSCWKEYLESKVIDGETEIYCPLCPRTIQREEVRQSVDQEVFKKYERFEANHKVESDPNLIWCPGPGCNHILTRPEVHERHADAPPNLMRDGIVCIMSLAISFAMAFAWGIGWPLAVSTASASLTFACQRWRTNRALQGNDGMAGTPVKCDRCSGIACFECKSTWHPGETCEEAQFSQLYLWTLDKDVGACPRCKCLIEKNKGCDHMTCKMCKRSFNWPARKRPQQLRQSFIFSSGFALSSPCCAMWILEIATYLREAGLGASLSILFDEFVSHSVIAALVFSGTWKLWTEIALPLLPPPTAASRDVGTFCFTVMLFGVLGSCKGMLALLGPLMCICLYNVCLEFASWRLRAGGVAEHTKKVLPLMPYAVVLSILVIVLLLAHLPPYPTQEPDPINRNGTSQLALDSEHVLQLCMERRCSILRIFHVVATTVAFAATLGGLSFLAHVFRKVFGLPLGKFGVQSAPVGMILFFFARLLNVAIALWIVVEGNMFQWPVRAAVVVFIASLLFILCGEHAIKFVLAHRLSYGSWSCVLIVIFLCLARLGFFVEDIAFVAWGGPTISFAASHALEILPCLKKACNVNKWTEFQQFKAPVFPSQKNYVFCQKILACGLALALLVLDLREDGSRGKVFQPALAIMTPAVCLCLMPLRQIGSEICKHVDDLSMPLKSHGHTTLATFQTDESEAESVMSDDS